MAEGVGFEPTIRFPVYTLSKRAPSATRPSLRSEAAEYSAPAAPSRGEGAHCELGKALLRVGSSGHPRIG
jgi:hypothetical protein